MRTGHKWLGVDLGGSLAGIRQKHRPGSIPAADWSVSNRRDRTSHSYLSAAGTTPMPSVSRMNGPAVRAASLNRSGRNPVS